MEHQVIIIGSGPAGLTAAIYAARSGLSPVVISGSEPGGQLTLTTDVEDFPGFPDGIQGLDLVTNMRKQAERFGVEFIDGSATAVNFSRPVLEVYVGDVCYRARAVIVATGAAAKWLGLPSEQRLIGHGVSSCAVCDGFFFRSKPVVVVGGGDSAAKEALYLSKICQEVTVIHRGTELRAQQVLQDRLRSTDNIHLLFGRTVAEIVGEATVVGIRVTDQSGQEETISASGIFIAIGHIPNTAFLNNAITCDAAGYVTSDDGVHTSVPGVFVAGDAQDTVYRQAVTAAGMGCRAAMEATEYLSENG